MYYWSRTILFVRKYSWNICDVCVYQYWCEYAMVSWAPKSVSLIQSIMMIIITCDCRTIWTFKHIPVERLEASTDRERKRARERWVAGGANGTTKHDKFRHRTKMWTLERQCHYKFVVSVVVCVILLPAAIWHTNKKPTNYQVRIQSQYRAVRLCAQIPVQISTESCSAGWLCG